MSKENLEQFMNQIAESEELQAKIGEEIDAEALIALGAECGCEFTAEELLDSAELSDEELDTVAGGALSYTIKIGEVRTIGTGIFEFYVLDYIRRKLGHKRGVRRAGGGGAHGFVLESIGVVDRPAKWVWMDRRYIRARTRVVIWINIARSTVC